jgi:hypothetical protein
MKGSNKNMLVIAGCFLLAMLVWGCIVESLFLLSNIPSESGLIDGDADGETDYAVLGLEDTIQFVFSEAVDPNSFDPQTSLGVSPEHDFEYSFTSTSAANDTLVLSPAAPYTPGQVYCVTLKADAVQPSDAESIRSIAYDKPRYFLAADKTADTTHPFVVSLYPPDGAIDVPCDVALSAVFSEKMMSVRAFAASGTPSLPSDLVLDGSENPVYTATTVEGFEPNTTYTIVFDPLDNASWIGTIDHTGNRLVANAGSTSPAQVQWSFTTGNCQVPAGLGGNTIESRTIVQAAPSISAQAPLTMGR